MLSTEQSREPAIIAGPWGAPEVPDLCLPQFVMREWEPRRNQVAMIDAPTGQSLTYGELASAVHRTASTLLAQGLRVGDVVALCCANSPAYAIAYYGALVAGATVTAVSPEVTEREAAAQLNDCDASWVITTSDLAGKLRHAAGERLKRLLDVGETCVAAPAANQPYVPDAASRVPIDPERVAMLLCSSGTTGLPKAVMLTHRNLVAGLCSFRAPEPVGAEDVVLAVLPMYHIAGIQIVMNPALSSGATVVTLPRFDLEAFLAAIERYQVTRIVVAPPIVLALAKHPIVDRYDLSSLRVIASGAAPLSGELARAAATRVGCRIKQGYGMTETGAICMAPDDGPDKPDSIGPPVPGVHCRIVNVVSGEDLAPGETGELIVRSPAQMRGYLGNAAATGETIDADGWLHTGDIARVDPDGWLHVVDRVKELIKYKGRSIAPAELEQILLTHPAVADVAVIGCPDEEAGELPKALVVLQAPADPSDLLSFVTDQVAPQKKLRRIEFVNSIPKSPSGKILRRVLVERERAAARRTQRSSLAA
jgi:acyl-CoA synthetase (AMP-forming)/AMP-acid ligase II